MSRKQPVRKAMLIVNDIRRNVVDVEFSLSSLECCRTSVNQYKIMKLLLYNNLNDCCMYNLHVLFITYVRHIAK